MALTSYIVKEVDTMKSMS